MDRGAPKNKFLTRTWALVNDPAMKPIISWADDGKSFVIHDVSCTSRASFLPDPYVNFMFSCLAEKRFGGVAAAFWVSHDRVPGLHPPVATLPISAQSDLPDGPCYAVF